MSDAIRMEIPVHAVESIAKNYGVDKEILMSSKERLESWYKKEEGVKKKGIHDYFTYFEQPEYCEAERMIVGIDLPTRFSETESLRKNKKIIIIGQDPLRHVNDFRDNEEFKQNKRLVVGTPYGLHINHYRNEKNIFWGLVEEIVKFSDVYLTDFRKDFIDSHVYQEERFHPNSIVQVNGSLDPNLLSINREVLRQEILEESKGADQLIAITLGAVPAKAFDLVIKEAKNDYEEVSNGIHRGKLIPLYHPSGARPKEWGDDFTRHDFRNDPKEKNLNERKKDYILERINRIWSG